MYIKQSRFYELSLNWISGVISLTILTEDRIFFIMEI